MPLRRACRPRSSCACIRARPLDPATAGPDPRVLQQLAARAGLSDLPRALRHPEHDAQRLRHRHARRPSIGVTEGLLRRLTLRRARRRAGARDQPHPQQRPRRHEPRRRHDALDAGPVLSRDHPGALQSAGLAAGQLRHLVDSALALLYLGAHHRQPAAAGAVAHARVRRRLEGAQLTGDPAGLAAASTSSNAIRDTSGKTWCCRCPAGAFRSPRCCARIRRPRSDRPPRGAENRALPPPSTSGRSRW